ncbi:LuxR C-terminal-related transcriptional regulator [Kitasatospora aureofaciens]|uniref:LuxR C-terminal-related transcriptional regulator n=1 Tax=Kitasatospora aureofaciens TaxID=1894 RepID=UPI0036F487D3
MPGTVLVADQADVALEALQACKKPGCLLVATCLNEDAELAELADLVVDLPHLDDSTAAALLSEDLGLDTTASDAIRRALGPWFGNPGTLVTVIDGLVAGNRLRPVRDRMCLADPEAPIALPADHTLLRRAAELGGPSQSVLDAVSVLGTCDLADLPHILLAELPTIGRAADALVELGVLKAENDGRLGIPFPALAAARATRLDRQTVRGMHRRYARYLLQERQRGKAVDDELLADHLAACESHLTEADDLPEWLAEQAEEVATYDPDRAAARWAAAWRLGAPVDPLRYTLGTGRYEVLRQLHADEPVTADSARRWDLAVVHMLTELGGSEPLPALANELPCLLAAWWTGRRASWVPAVPRPDDGERLMSAAELNTLFYALSVQPQQCAEALRSVREPQAYSMRDDLIEAGAAGDVASVLEIVLGSRYRVPRTGVIAEYQRVLRAYMSADWEAALQAVRQLELLGNGGSPAHHLARLYAAAIHIARGELRQAAAWLAAVSHSPRFAVARAIVETMLLHRRGASTAALNLARRALHHARRHGFRSGQERLLLIALQITLRSGDKLLAKTLMREIEALHRQEHSRCTRQTLLLGRGLLHGDVSSAAAGVELVRERGHRPDLLWACHILAQFCDDPRHVIDELHAIAQRDGTSSLLPAQVDALLGKFGSRVARPAGRGAFSANDFEIIEMITLGWTNRQIAMRLNISEKTVENHMTGLLARAGCRSRVELVAASLAGRLPESS